MNPFQRRINQAGNEFREFAEDPKRTMPLAIAVGALKGAIVGLAIGKVALATAAGIAGGAVVGAALSWRAQRAKATADKAEIPR
ncbi:MAG: hypothetical protein JWR16_653 [Nevskia sp.]|jgi:hypothetical protein|nr:hypothetical protein [Nevskia sp.]